MNSVTTNQLQQCAACHKNINRLKELQSKTTVGLLCLDEMTSVVAKLHIYLEQIQSDVGDVIGDLSLNAGGVGGQQMSSTRQPAGLQEETAKMRNDLNLDVSVNHVKDIVQGQRDDLEEVRGGEKNQEVSMEGKSKSKVDTMTNMKREEKGSCPKNGNVKPTIIKIGSVNAIHNQVANIDQMKKKKACEKFRLSENSTTSETGIMQTKPRPTNKSPVNVNDIPSEESPKSKTKSVVVALPSTKKGIDSLDSISTADSPGGSSSKVAQSINTDYRKGNQTKEQMAKSKGKIIGTLPPPSHCASPKTDKTSPITLKGGEQDEIGPKVLPSPKVKSATVATPKVKVKSVVTELPSKKKVTTNKLSKVVRKTQFIRTNDRLSQYIKKGKQNSKKSVNPIFNLLQNEETLDQGRLLLQLEGKASQHRKTISNLQSMKEDTIKAYTKKETKSKLEGKTAEDIEQLEKEKRIIETGKKLAAALQQKAKDDKKLADEKELRDKMIAKYDKQIVDETKELEAVRAELRKVKGSAEDGTAEDPNFSMDGNRDDRGHSYLMVTSQNNDYVTAEICLRLGADPSLSTRNEEGLSAIHYSTFFGFHKVTNLIIEVRLLVLLADCIE